MKRRVLVLLSGLALACVASASYAQHNMSGFHGPGAGFHGGHFANGGFHHFHHFHDGRFHTRFAVFVGTPFFWADAATAWRALTDYDRYTEFIPDLRVSRVRP